MRTRKPRHTSVRSRELGAELRHHRKRAGLVSEQLAAMLGFSASKVSVMENGWREYSEVDLTRYLAFCRAPIPDMDRALAMYRQDGDGFWIQPHGERLADELHTLIRQETTACGIDDFELVFVPGLLQTEDYARALIACGVARTDQIEGRVQARMDRQAVLRQYQPAQFTFLIHEFGLRMMVGNPQIMHEQMLHLMFWSDRPQCSIRIVPASAGPLPGMTGPFRLMEFAEHRPIAYAENEIASLFVEDHEAVGRYRIALRALAKAALDEGQSRSLLAELVSEYDRPGAQRHELAPDHGPDLA